MSIPADAPNRPKAPADTKTVPLRSAGQSGSGPTTANVPYPHSRTIRDLDAETGVRYSFLRPAEGPEELGRLGGYRVRKLLQKGGMGYVFEAEDVALGRQVALKVMKPDLDVRTGGGRRFLREARLMATLNHDHVVKVYQVSEEGSVIFLAMELLRGQTLAERTARAGRLPVPEVLRIGREVAAGLTEIHRQGLVHRDLTPSNIWLEEPGGKVKILDFGVARLQNDDVEITQPGTILGTPAYMSPEQAAGERVDARSDLFTLGSVLYSLCTGLRPFPGTNPMAVLTTLAVHEPAPVCDVNPAVPTALGDLVMQLLSKDPADRPQTAHAVVDALSRIEAGRLGRAWPWKRLNSRARRRLVALAAALVLTTAGPALISTLAPARPVQELASTTDRTFLTDLTPVAAENWTLEPNPDSDDPIERHPPHRAPGVIVRGSRSPHGVFMHPRPGPWNDSSYIRYRLDKQFRRFVADVSLNDGPEWAASPIRFTVHGDGRLLWSSAAVISQADRQSCDIAVDGIEMLTIGITVTGDPRGAHSVWIEPHLLK